ncbi:PARP-domain-containing protein [Acephala macrosclerotiorum]|nr:PARP-domain-containing protein [Acephala macrosclerotiorum]
MPPKKATKAKASPLQGCKIALSGTFPGYTQPVLEQQFIKALGATLSATVSKLTTQLVAAESDFAKPSAKVEQAKSHDIPIVQLSWLQDCLAQGTKLSEDDYRFGASALAPASTNTNLAPRKRPVIADDDSEEERSQSKPIKKAKGSQVASQSTSTNGTNSGSKPTTLSKIKTDVVSGPTNIAKSPIVNIPIDETCPLTHYAVFIDDEGTIYDANLNQTNASNNNNKFYRVQLLRNNGDYKTWTRWGRVGEIGSGKVLGNGSFDNALHEFESKFKSKSGLAWADRGAKPKTGKYTYIERSYEQSDDEDEGGTLAEAKPKEKLEVVESKLAPQVQELLKLIFNQQFFAATMTELNYDVAKLPLGKLSKNTITRGYQALKDLSALIDDPSLAQSGHGTSFQAAAEELSNAFYSLIPHAFGRNRPPIIHEQGMLKREIEMLDSLSDMKDAANIMKEDTKAIERVNILDQQFKGLNLEEMTPLSSNSTEFVELSNYLVGTRGETHNANYQIQDIFRIERQGEKDRFEKSPFSGPPRDRRLLWHGSRCTNFGGILSQGLRIAPPEAPVSGYMFGKGIYLADMSSKSANYCVPHISNGTALLLLCEAELGNPMQVLTNASYKADEDAKANGLLSTWGQGMTGPSHWKDAEAVHPSLKGVKIPDTQVKPGRTGVPNAYLMYNEYIAYDIAQVRLRYLFRVKM